MQNENGSTSPAVRTALYRRLRTALSRKSAGAIRQVAKFLFRLEASGIPYAICQRLLDSEMRRLKSNLLNSAISDDTRRTREYAREAFHLIRREFQALRGQPQSKAHIFSVGQLSGAVSAHIDGSVRNGLAAVGIVIRAKSRDIVTVAMSVEAKNSAEAEMHALLVAMKTTIALGRKKLFVYTDAEALVALLREQSRLRFHRLGREVLATVNRFNGFALAVVPRIHNHRADKLALALTGLA